ncbi:helix-turn-helix domain-containing protein [Saccharopolyspora erythraea]|uniref:helix-turn-helix domain-containing protein n=1 Tax=Saccharopolyspora erythraea TaxID=1836 RepID=UPI001BA89B6D|nr:helix-turn-helix domain-containing protein [Saccharopolyspora erythraea]QUG99394.1 helix-turn-helix domain-containing protein [Saccharopolyspora erythraea]
MARQDATEEPARLTANEADGGTPPASAVLYTPAEAARLLAIKESWLRRKASMRTIPCTFLGKHLRFSDENIREIVHISHSPAARSSQRH